MVKRVVILNHPALKTVCTPVNVIDGTIGSEAEEIVRDMIDSFISLKDRAVGLASNQLGYLLRIIIVAEPFSSKLEVMINPEIVSYSKETNVEVEGCLSYPMLSRKVTRPSALTLKAWVLDDVHTMKFVEIEKSVMGYEARICFHEMDHLNGSCILSKKR